MVMGLVSGLWWWVVFIQSFWLRVLPGGAASFSQGGRQQEGFWEVVGHVASPFDLSGWWWLISSVFLTRTSCCKTTHANGYYGDWAGWAVSISVLPLTQWLLEDPFKRTVHLKDSWNSPHQNKFKSQLTLSLMEAGQTLSKDSAERWRIFEKEACLGMSLPGDQLPEWQSEDLSEQIPTKKQWKYQQNN